MSQSSEINGVMIFLPSDSNLLLAGVGPTFMMRRSGDCNDMPFDCLHKATALAPKQTML